MIHIRYIRDTHLEHMYAERSMIDRGVIHDIRAMFHSDCEGIQQCHEDSLVVYKGEDRQAYVPIARR